MNRILSEDSNWTRSISECTVSARLPDTCLYLPVYGCSDNGRFCHISPRINHNRISYRDGRLNPHSIILEIQGYKVSGYTHFDLEELVQSLTVNCEPIIIKTIANNYLPSTIKEYLSQFFPDNSFDQDLQRVIRDNVYLRVVPCTTRKPRLGEINGIDYQFLTIEEFLELDRSDGLIESGIFDGNYYGTPKPSNRYQRIPNTGSLDDNPSLPSSTDLDEWELGPLPDHWEMAFTDDNYRYFIDHNTGTTQWNDPRLPGDSSEEVIPNLEDLNLDESLPYGWEKVYDAKYGVFYIDHNNKRTQYEPPDLAAFKASSQSLKRTSTTTSLNSMAPSCTQFTTDPSKLSGTIARTTLIKSPRGFGFTIIGGSDRCKPEFLQIKHVMTGGPAAVDGFLDTGDVLVYVDNCLVLGFLHSDIVALFQRILIGQHVTLTVCKGYPLPGDASDPRTHVVTTMAVDNISVLTPHLDDTHIYLPCLAATSEASLSSAKSSLSAGGSNNDTTIANANFFAKNAQSEFIKINIMKSCTGFGFTLSDNIRGQRVKQILDQSRCGRLKEGDILVEINKTRIKEKSHQEVVQILKDCPEGNEVILLVQRVGLSTQSSNSSGYSGSTRLQVSVASPIPSSLATKISGHMPMTGDVLSNMSNISHPATVLSQSVLESRDITDKRGLSDLAVANYLSQQPPEEINVACQSHKTRSRTPGPENSARKCLYRDNPDFSETNIDFYNTDLGSMEYNSLSRRPKTPTAAEMRTSSYWDTECCPDFTPVSNLLSNSVLADRSNNRNDQSDGHGDMVPAYGSLSRLQKFRHSIPHTTKIGSIIENDDTLSQVFYVTLNKQSSGFGFRIIGGAEDNTMITIGPLIPDGAAIKSGQIRYGDELVSVNGASVVLESHKKAVQLVEAASRLGSVTLGLRHPGFKSTSTVRRGGPFDVTLTRSESEGFGFVIVTSMTRSGSHIGEYIGRLIDDSPAQRCGLLRIDDRIMAVNGVSVAKMRHEKIVHTIKNCGPTVTMRINPGGQDDCSDDQEIILNRGPTGFGFSIRGGQDFNKIPLFVLKISDDGPAKLDGRLKVGDKILQINGKNTTGMTHSQAINIIQAGGNIIRLLARRPSGQGPISVHSSGGQSQENSTPNKRPVMPPQYNDYETSHHRSSTMTNINN